MANLQITSDYQKLRQKAMGELIYKGVRVPTQKQISIYILTGKVVKEK